MEVLNAGQAPDSSSNAARDKLRKRGSTAKSSSARAAPTAPENAEESKDTQKRGHRRSSTEFNLLLHEQDAFGDLLRRAAAEGRMDDARRLLKHVKEEVLSEAEQHKVGERLSVGHTILGTTALHKAAMYNQCQMTTFLIDNGVSVDCRDRGGRTPLMLAASNGHVELLSMLVQREAQIDANAFNGWNAAMYAAAGGHVAVLTKLCDLEPALDEEESEAGEMALEIAVRHDRSDATALLRERRWQRRQDAKRAEEEAREAANAARLNALEAKRRGSVTIGGADGRVSPPPGAETAAASRKPRRGSMVASIGGRSSPVSIADVTSAVPAAAAFAVTC